MLITLHEPALSNYISPSPLALTHGRDVPRDYSDVSLFCLRVRVISKGLRDRDGYATLTGTEGHWEMKKAEVQVHLTLEFEVQRVYLHVSCVAL